MAVVVAEERLFRINLIFFVFVFVFHLSPFCFFFIYLGVLFSLFFLPLVPPPLIRSHSLLGGKQITRSPRLLASFFSLWYFSLLETTATEETKKILGFFSFLSPPPLSFAFVPLLNFFSSSVKTTKNGSHETRIFLYLQVWISFFRFSFL